MARKESNVNSERKFQTDLMQHIEAMGFGTTRRVNNTYYIYTNAQDIDSL